MRSEKLRLLGKAWRAALAVSVCGVAAWAVALSAEAAEPNTPFFNAVGLQLYSLRDQFAKDVPGTLDRTRDYGVHYVEIAGTYDLPLEKFAAMLKERNLQPIGMHFPYGRLRDDVEGCARDAKTLGLKYVGCAWAEHKEPFDEKQCREVAEVFNRAGKALAKHGLTFYYHNHGFEFQPWKDGETLFDMLVQKTDPKYVTFQLDVLWAVLPGQDPVKLIEKYPGRWSLLHLKDLKKGVPTGKPQSSTDLTNDVTLGTGQVNWAPLIRAAMKDGVKYFFIEDESPSVTTQIPKSLEFLKKLEY
jgi:sugar phosphate isomerase/epimerase